MNWNGPPIWRHVLCVGWGELGSIRYIEARSMRPGRFHDEDLLRVHADLSSGDAIVVGHNVASMDLPILNGLFVVHGLPMLPDVRFQDTMNTVKTGYTYRNTLRAQCERYGITLKTGSPDWDRVLQGFREEWELMETYNMNDVVCTLELERALADAGLPCPIGIWTPRKRGKS